MFHVRIGSPTRIERLDAARYKKLTADELRSIMDSDMSKEDIIDKWIAVQPESNKKNGITGIGFPATVLVFSHTGLVYLERDVVALSICRVTYIEWDTLCTC